MLGGGDASLYSTRKGEKKKMLMEAACAADFDGRERRGPFPFCAFERRGSILYQIYSWGGGEKRKGVLPLLSEERDRRKGGYNLYYDERGGGMRI